MLMRRDLSEKLEFGEMYPETESTPNKSTTKKAAKPAKKVKKPSQAKKVTPPAPEQKPQIAEPLKPVEPDLPVIRDEGSSLAKEPLPPARGDPEWIVRAEPADSLVTDHIVTWSGIFTLLILIVVVMYLRRKP